MPEIQKVSIALTGEQVLTLRQAVDSGEYATTSEIVREALRDWQRKRDRYGEDVQLLRQLWTEGKQSGPAVAINPKQIHKKAQQRLKEAGQTRSVHAG